MSLPRRQQLFVDYYLVEPNATKAAIAAGYSKKTAYSQGQRLLKNVEIGKAVNQKLINAGMTANEVLEELAKIAKGPHSTYRSDKVKSLELLGKHHKLFTDKMEHSGPNGKPIETTTKIVIQGIAGNDSPEQPANTDT